MMVIILKGFGKLNNNILFTNTYHTGVEHKIIKHKNSVYNY